MSASDRFPIRWLPSKGLWEVDVRPHGRIRAVQFPGSETPIKLIHRDWAEEVRRTILRDIAKGVPAPIAVSPYLPRESLLERWVERWMDHLEALVEAGERSPTYTRRLRDFTRPQGSFAPLYGMSIHSIDYGVIEDFAAELREQDLSPTTVVHVLSALRTCLRWVEKRSRGVYAAPPFPELRRGRYEPVLLDPEQQDAVLAEIREDQRGAFLAMVDLMIRPGEARAVNVEDYDFRVRELTVRNAMKGPALDAPRRETKGRDRRELEVTTRLAEWLEAFVSLEARMSRTVPLFQNRGGRDPQRRFSYYTLAALWRQACVRAGAPATGLYAGTKHSTATWLRKRGLHLDEISLALGHSSPRAGRVTEMYARPPRVANATVVRVLNERGRRSGELGLDGS